MEDKAIKDFDRSIESMMNEHSVAPPFGAWNRIAGELDAIPAAATAIPGRSPLFNTGTVVGFVSGALMIGSMVTGWLVYNNYNAEQTDKNLAVVTQNEVSKGLNFAPAKTGEVQTITPIVEAKTVSIAKAITKQDKSVTENTSVKVIATDVAAPTVKVPVDKEKQAGEAYYFPPVDIDVPDNKIQNTNNATTVVKEEIKTEPAKIEVKKSSSSGDRVKFKKKKPAKWNYGRLNRTKSKSKY